MKLSMLPFAIRRERMKEVKCALCMETMIREGRTVDPPISIKWVCDECGTELYVPEELIT